MIRKYTVILQDYRNGVADFGAYAVFVEADSARSAGQVAINEAKEAQVLMILSGHADVRLTEDEFYEQ